MTSQLEKKFLNELLDMAETEDLNIYNVIGDLLNGEYKKYCTESTGLMLERAYDVEVQLELPFHLDQAA